MKQSWVAIAVVLAFAPAFWPDAMLRAADAEEEQAECPAGDGWLECRAQAGDRLAVYRLGRTAYEDARESGDFTEALRLARRLQATGDRNGERLLKMVYMQLGWGAHKDYVQAYVWMSEANAGGTEYLDKWRQMLAEKMTPQQLEEARKLAAN